MSVVFNPFTGNLDFTGASTGGGGTPPFTLLTADPASPTDDTWWVVREGASPNMIVSIKVRIAGVTTPIVQFGPL